MKLKETEDILSLFKNGKAIKEHISKQLPRIYQQLEDVRCKTDKHNDGFYLEDAVQSFNIPRLCYKSFTGSYGNSSVYSDLTGLDSDLFQKYFLKYLNKHKSEILISIGDMMIKDAEIKKQSAIAELKDLINEVENISNNPE